MELPIFRQKGLDALSTIISNINNISILERNIFENLPDDYDIDLYNYHMFQIIHDIINGQTIKKTLENIKSKKSGWNHSIFNDIHFRIDEQDNFIMKPFEVSEGVLTCTKCGSNRTFSHAKQVRSCDEGTSVFATCMGCKNSWVTSG